MAGPGPYKKLAAQAAQVKAGTGLGQLLKTLKGKQDSKDADEAAEAKMMFESLSAAGKGRLEKAVAQKATEPTAALEKLDKLAQQFAGDEIGDQAKKEAEALKKDPAVKKELDADYMLKQAQAMVDKLKPVQGEKDPKNAAFKKANAASIQTIVATCQSIGQRYPGTAAAKKAEELANEYK